MLSKLLKALVILLIPILGAIYISKTYSTTLRMEVFDWRVEVDLIVACCIMLFAFFLIWVFVSSICYILRLPSNIKSYFSEKGADSQMRELKDVIIDINNQDVAKLKAHLKHTADAPIALLLRYHIAKIEDDIPSCKKHVLDLLKFRETYVIGLVKFIELCELEEHWSDISAHSKQLLEYKPSKWSDSIIIKSYILQELWDQLSAFLTLEKHKLSIDKSAISVLNAIALYKNMEKIFYIKHQIAETDCKKLFVAAEDFLPCLALLIEIRIHIGQYQEAAYLLSKSWMHSSRILIKTALRLIRTCPTETIIKISRNIIAEAADQQESLLLMAYANLLGKKAEAISPEYIKTLGCSEDILESLFLLEYAVYKDNHALHAANYFANLLNTQEIAQVQYYWDYLHMTVSTQNGLTSIHIASL